MKILLLSIFLSLNAFANFNISKDNSTQITITKNMEPDKSCKFIKEDYFKVEAKEIYTKVLEREVLKLKGNFILIKDPSWHSNLVGGLIYSCPN